MKDLQQDLNILLGVAQVAREGNGRQQIIVCGNYNQADLLRRDLTRLGVRGLGSKQDSGVGQMLIGTAKDIFESL